MLEDLLKRLLKRKIDEEVIIHFRLATHGSVSIKNCHPFRIGDYWFAHNGVLPIRSINDRTDSQICFTTSIYPVIKEYGWCSEEHIEVMDYWTRNGSKFAMMHNGEVVLSGNFIKRKGCYYSNLNHICCFKVI